MMEYVAIALCAGIAGYIRWRFPETAEDYIDDRWTRADLSKVPPVITQPEPRGHVLPWYRRVLRRAPPSEEAPRELTTYRS